MGKYCKSMGHDAVIVSLQVEVVEEYATLKDGRAACWHLVGPSMNEGVWKNVTRTEMRHAMLLTIW